MAAAVLRCFALHGMIFHEGESGVWIEMPSSLLTTEKVKIVALPSDSILDCGKVQQAGSRVARKK